jgi:hypothetical protein
MKHLHLLIVVALLLSACASSKEFARMTYGSGEAVVDASGVWTYQLNGISTGIHPYSFDNGPDYFEEGFARFVVNGKFGFFNQGGKVVIKPSYDFATPFQEGRAVVCDGCTLNGEGEHTMYEGGKWGFIDQAGTLVIPMKYERAEMFQDGRATVVLDSKTLSIDVQGVIQQ